MLPNLLLYIDNLPPSTSQIIQELEKQRLEILSTTLDRYRLHTLGFGQSLLQVRLYSITFIPHDHVANILPLPAYR